MKETWIETGRDGARAWELYIGLRRSRYWIWLEEPPAVARRKYMIMDSGRRVMACQSLAEAKAKAETEERDYGPDA
jgi:hypothetical protein